MARTVGFGLRCFLALSLVAAVCNRGERHSVVERAGKISARGNSLLIGQVVLRSVGNQSLNRTAARTGYTNGTDTYYTRRLPDGGVFVLHRYAPSVPTITANPYPTIDLPG